LAYLSAGEGTYTLSLRTMDQLAWFIFYYRGKLSIYFILQTRCKYVPIRLSSAPASDSLQNKIDT
jgi:hypothetical protein